MAVIKNGAFFVKVDSILKKKMWNIITNEKLYAIIYHKISPNRDTFDSKMKTSTA